MAEEVGIVMKLYDQVSPSLKSIAGNTKAFDKDMDELEASLKAYDRVQTSLTDSLADLKKKLEASNAEVRDARKAYKELNDEASKKALDEAIDKQVELQRKMAETKSVIDANTTAYKTMYKEAGVAASKLRNQPDAPGILQSLAQAGLFNMLGDSIGTASNALVGSALGDSAGNMVSSVLGSAISGAAIGSLAGAPGAAIGAVVGGISGAISGAAANFEGEDQAFQSYVQESVENQQSQMESDIASGSAIAGNREQKQLAFSTLLGSDQAAENYLDQVQKMASLTNYTYDEITTYAKSLVKPFGADRSLSVLTTLSDASAALSLNESDNSVLIAGLSRMRMTDKTTQEYLNYFSERGIDVYEALAKWGDAATVAEKVTKGQISGIEAADALLTYMEEQYGGLSAKMAETYQGMVDNLSDAEANAQAAYGEGYNEARKEGIQEQMDWLNSGVMDEANRALGAWQAELENSKEQYERDALSALMNGTDVTYFKEEMQDRLSQLFDEYQQAKAEDNAAEMGRLIMEAKIIAQNEYNASEGAQLALDSELTLAEAIRSDTRSNDAYWNAGHQKGQQYSKGLAQGIEEYIGDFNKEVLGIDTGPTWTIGTPVQGYTDHMESFTYTPTRVNVNISNSSKTSEGNELWFQSNPMDGVSPYSDAFGLRRVPYDNYPALLHEGERVLTASEARAADSSAARPVTVTFSGPITINQDSDIDTLAGKLSDAITLATKAGVR